MIADYYLVRRRTLDLDGLYTKVGRWVDFPGVNGVDFPI